MSQPKKKCCYKYKSYADTSRVTLSSVDYITEATTASESNAIVKFKCKIVKGDSRSLAESDRSVERVKKNAKKNKQSDKSDEKVKKKSRNNNESEKSEEKVKKSARNNSKSGKSDNRVKNISKSSSESDKSEEKINKTKKYNGYSDESEREVKKGTKNKKIEARKKTTKQDSDSDESEGEVKKGRKIRKTEEKKKTTKHDSDSNESLEQVQKETKNKKAEETTKPSSYDRVLYVYKNRSGNRSDEFIGKVKKDKNNIIIEKSGKVVKKSTLNDNKSLDSDKSETENIDKAASSTKDITDQSVPETHPCHCKCAKCGKALLEPKNTHFIYGIIDHSDAYGRINEKHHMRLEDSFNKCLAKLMLDTAGAPVIQISKCEFVEGIFMITLTSRDCVDRLQCMVEKMPKWAGAKLRFVSSIVLPLLTKASFEIDCYGARRSSKEVFKIIERQNPGLNVDLWQIYRKNDTEDGADLVVGIDPCSFACLKNSNGTMYFLTGKLQVKLENTRLIEYTLAQLKADRNLAARVLKISYDQTHNDDEDIFS